LSPTKKGRDGLASIIYKKDGKYFDMQIGCLYGVDTEESIKKHFDRHNPECRFISVIIKPVNGE
jgi:hypothetical protein|tara:strand:- start:1041 stop:1232 length:192 start_codon:yes stop_codon:yes gene_type:complete